MTVTKETVEKQIPIKLSMLPRETVKSAYKKKERIVVEKQGYKLTLLLDKLRVNYGDRYYLKCTACKSRRDILFLYLFKYEGIQHATGVCRDCMNLNYRSQQRTRTDEFFYYLKMVEICVLLGAQESPDPENFVYEPAPDRPKGMHWKTYNNHVAKYYKYRDAAFRIVHEKDLKEMSRIRSLLFN